MLNFSIFLLSLLQRSPLLGIFGVRRKRREGFVFTTWRSFKASEKEVVWFHAASLGELEMLRPLIEDFHQRGVLIGISAFSDSALKGLEHLKSIAVYAGLSPPESDWLPLFQHFKVRKLILAKYEFWPGLIRAASVVRAPVVVINAQDRKSLRRLRQIFWLSFTRFPEFYFYANEKKIADRLLIHFGKIADVALAPDPRFERVARRKQNVIYDERLKVNFDKISRLPGCVGILGSAWLEDLKVLLPALVKTKNSLVVVPHDLSRDYLKKIHALLANHLTPERYLIVEEMGLLAELYEAADWVWIGGGFGKGIHSLIEPALFDLPLACGPKNFEMFPEARVLQEKNALTCCSTTQDAEIWLNGRAKIPLPAWDIQEIRRAYRALLEECIRIE